MVSRKTASGHRYHIEAAGAGPALLLLHGFSGDRSTWRGLRQNLSRDFQLVCLDILGHGKSDKPASPSSYRMPDLAADIMDLLQQRQITAAHMLGYSMGGRLALYLALRYPGRFASLALESASPGLAEAAKRAQRRRQDEDLADRIEAQGIGWFVDYWESLPLWASQNRLPAEVRAAQRRQRLGNDARGLANSLRAMGSGAQPSLWHALPSLTIPTLLLHGELDDKFHRINAAMAEKMPNAQLVCIPSAGHNTHLENPAAFARALRSFLQRR